MSYPISTKICSKCKVEKPLSEFHKRKRNKDGFRRTCKVCILSYHKEYAKKNVELIKKRRRKFYEKNADKIKKKSNEYYQSNSEKCNKLSRAYYEKNKETIRVKAKVYREDHIEEKRMQDKSYREKNLNELKEKKKEYYQTEHGKNLSIKAKHRRRAAKYGVGYESFSPSEIFERDGYKCQLCGIKTRPDFKSKYHPKYPNLDHIIPLSKGGKHNRKNTQCLCRRCNATKHDSEDFGDQQRLFG